MTLARHITVQAWCCSLAVIACVACAAQAMAGTLGAWLDSDQPENWNSAHSAIPAAPQGARNPDPRCRELARAPDSEADRQLRERGWDLVGPYTAGWDIQVVHAAADYDGMCRPRQFQDFVFVTGVFAGTLSPQPMDSRSDGALTRVTIQSAANLTAEYARYTARDPLCCPSGSTAVMFHIEREPPLVSPTSAVR